MSSKLNVCQMLRKNWARINRPVLSHVVRVIKQQPYDGSHACEQLLPVVTYTLSRPVLKALRHWVSSSCQSRVFKCQQAPTEVGRALLIILETPRYVMSRVFHICVENFLGQCSPAFKLNTWLKQWFSVLRAIWCGLKRERVCATTVSCEWNDLQPLIIQVIGSGARGKRRWIYIRPTPLSASKLPTANSTLIVICQNINVTTSLTNWF